MSSSSSYQYVVEANESTPFSSLTDQRKYHSLDGDDGDGGGDANLLDADGESNNRSKESPPASNNQKKIILYRRRWVMLFVFALAQFLCTVYQMTFASMSTVVLKYYKIPESSSWKVNSLAIAYMIAYVPMSLASSMVMKKYGLKASVFIAVMFNFVGGCVRLAGFKKGRELFFWIVFSGQCITALAQPFVGNATTMLASNWFGEKERTTATTIATFLSILGSAFIFGVGPSVVGDGTETGMAILLGGEAALAAFTLLMFVMVFRERPPTPPTLGHHHHHSHRRRVQHSTNSAIHHIEHYPEVPISDSITSQKGDMVWNQEQRAIIKTNGDISDDLSSSSSSNEASEIVPSKITIPIGPSNVHLEPNSFAKDFWIVIKNIHFIFLIISFSVGYAVVQSFSVMLDQIIVPMGYSVKDGSVFGVIVVFCGMTGAVVMGLIADYTKRYKLLLCISGVGGCASFAWFSINMLHHRTPTRMIISCISIALLGIFACPTVPLTLELSVETTYPVPESISASILNACSTLVSALCVIVLDFVEKDVKNGSMQSSLWICLGLLTAAIIPTFLFNSKYKRLEFERQKKGQHQQQDIISGTSIAQVEQ